CLCTYVYYCRSTYLFFLLILRPLRPTLFPYTTLFRSFSLWALESKDSLEKHFSPSGWGSMARFRGSLKTRQTVSFRWRRSRSPEDRKSTRLNSSHQIISYAVFCLKKKKKKNRYIQV